MNNLKIMLSFSLGAFLTASGFTIFNSHEAQGKHTSDESIHSVVLNNQDEESEKYRRAKSEGFNLFEERESSQKKDNTSLAESESIPNQLESFLDDLFADAASFQTDEERHEMLISVESEIEKMGRDKFSALVVEKFSRASTIDEQMELLTLIGLAPSKTATDFALSLLDYDGGEGEVGDVASYILANSEHAISDPDVRNKIIYRLHEEKQPHRLGNFIEALRNDSSLSTADIESSKQALGTLIDNDDWYVRSQALTTYSTLAQSNGEITKLVSQSLNDESADVVSASLDILYSNLMDRVERDGEVFSLSKDMEGALANIANSSSTDMNTRYIAMGSLLMSQAYQEDGGSFVDSTY